MFFMFFFVAVVELGLLAVMLRWSLSAPHGPLDGTARVVMGAVAGGLLATWIVGAALFPKLNADAKRTLTSPAPPSMSETRQVMNELMLAAPVDVNVAAGIGAGLGFLVALASGGSFRRVEQA